MRYRTTIARGRRAGAEPAGISASGATEQTDSMTVGELLEAAAGAEPATISALLEAERAGKNRTSAISGLERLLAR